MEGVKLPASGDCVCVGNLVCLGKIKNFMQAKPFLK